MASTIDPTKPTPVEALTADVRANFSAAKSEIEALQNGGVSVAATGTPTTRTLAAHLSDFPTLKDYGAVGNGTDDDTAAITAADTGTFADLYVPGGIFPTTANATSLSKNYLGPGQIKTGANKRGKFFSAIKAAPASEGNHDSIDTAFNGDLSHSIFQVEHRITGAATLGQPTTGYKYTPEAYPHRTYLYNASGHNQSTSGNSGRTAACAYRTTVANFGQGDCVAYNANAFVTGTKAGSTSFLANPAASLFNGGMTAGADGVYLNPRELMLVDAGYDVACIGDVVNMNRTNATGAKEAWWAGYRVQSIGAQPLDVAYSAFGPITRGLDLTPATLGTAKAAVSVKGGDRIYLNATAADARFANAFGDDYLHFNNSGIETVVDGTVRQIVNANGVGIGLAPGAGVPLQVFRSGSETSVVRNQVQNGTARFDLWKSSDDANCGEFYSLKTRAGFTAVQNNDNALVMSGLAYDGAASRVLGRITMSVDGTPGSGDMPGRITFSTAADGGVTLAERLRINNAGVISHRNNAQTIVSAASHLTLRPYTVATLPSAANAGELIYISDGSTNRRMAVSDGTNWRFPDGDIVS